MTEKKSEAVRFFTALTAALIVVAATWFVRHPSDATLANPVHGSRAPAASALRLDSAKKTRIEENTHAHHVGKATGVFTVSMSGEDLGEGRLIVRATVSSDRHIASHEFNWVLPIGYKIISGLERGILTEFQPGDSRNLEITVARGESAPGPIVIHVYKMIGGEPRGQIAQYDFAAVDPQGATAQKSAVPPHRDLEYVQ